MPDQCTFPRAERLTRSSEYRQVFQHGDKYVGRCFVCYMVRRETQGCRLGLAVSRKVGKAVLRNRIKRYIREYYRTHRSAFLLSVDVVIVARSACASLSYNECGEALAQLLRRGGVLNA